VRTHKLSFGGGNVKRFSRRAVCRKFSRRKNFRPSKMDKKTAAPDAGSEREWPEVYRPT
jgi:hypothetical protein